MQFIPSNQTQSPPFPNEYNTLKTNINNTNTFYSYSRKDNIDYIKNICTLFQYSRVTMHKAIQIYDKYLFLTSPSIDSLNKLKLIALICVDLSAKMEEIQTYTLTSYIFCYYYNNHKRIEMITQYYMYLQFDILKQLSWRLNDITIFNVSEAILFLWKKDSAMITQRKENAYGIKEKPMISYDYNKEVRLLIDNVVYDKEYNEHLYVNLALGFLFFSIMTNIVSTPNLHCKFKIKKDSDNVYRDIFANVREIDAVRLMELNEDDCKFVTIIMQFDSFCIKYIGVDIVEDVNYLSTLKYCFEYKIKMHWLIKTEVINIASSDNN